MRGKFPVYSRRAGFRLALAKEKATSYSTRARHRHRERRRARKRCLGEKKKKNKKSAAAAKVLLVRENTPPNSSSSCKMVLICFARRRTHRQRLWCFHRFWNDGVPRMHRPRVFPGVSQKLSQGRVLFHRWCYRLFAVQLRV
jgi:hypothetical protein